MLGSQKVSCASIKGLSIAFQIYLKIVKQISMTTLHAKNFLLTCLLIIFWHSNASSETVYVTDKMRVGIYASQDLDSKILKILSTGDRLEIVRETELMSLVIDDSGMQGWIDKNYLMKNKPAAMLLKDVSEKSNRDVLQQKVTIAPKENHPATDDINTKTNDLKKNNTRLKTKLAQVLPRVKQCESRASILEKKNERLNEELTIKCASVDMTSEDTVPLLNYQKLEKQLTDLKSSINDQVTKKQPLSENGSSPVSIIKYYWLWIVASMVVLIVFGAVIGAYLLDHSNRRRHCGFRI